MRTTALFACLLLAACASSPEPPVIPSEETLRAREEEKRIAQFLSKTPFEVCKGDPQLVKRYGGMADCKAGIRDEQKRMRDAMDAQRAEQEARRNVILQHYLRKNFR